MPLAQHLTLIIARTRALIGLLASPYRPEQHYMRGPGPKWRAKHMLAD
jgi:hypothetical protein